LIVVAIVHPLLHREGHQVPGAAPDLQCLPSKPECTPGNYGRVVRRSFDEGLLERVRAYRETEPYRNALRKRKVWVEPMFAEAKEWHRMRRFRLRRLWRVNIEALLIAAGQNVKRLLTFWGRDRGGWRSLRPCGLGHLPLRRTADFWGAFVVGDPHHSREFFNTPGDSGKWIYVVLHRSTPE
jgi:Transposase DDE domain